MYVHSAQVQRVQGIMRLWRGKSELDRREMVPAAPDLGGYYYFRNPGFQLLSCYGHTVAGQQETYIYMGLYWTWGKAKGDVNKGRSLLGKLHPAYSSGR